MSKAILPGVDAVLKLLKVMLAIMALLVMILIAWAIVIAIYYAIKGAPDANTLGFPVFLQFGFGGLLVRANHPGAASNGTPDLEDSVHGDSDRLLR